MTVLVQQPLSVCVNIKRSEGSKRGGEYTASINRGQSPMMLSSGSKVDRGEGQVKNRHEAGLV